MRCSPAALLIAFAALASNAARAEDPTPPTPPPALVTAAPPADTERPPEHVDANAAIVYIGDDGGLNFEAVRALRGIAESALRKRGVVVIDDVRAEGTLTRDAAQRIMRDLRVGRGFSVEAQGRLGNKVPLQVEEFAQGSTAPIYSASLTATSLDECDVIIPRLVNAVLDRQPVEDSAQMASVTREESRQFRKRPGEMHWALGLAIPTFEGSSGSGSPVGFSTQLFYEMEHVNIGVEALYASNEGLGAGGLFFQANWLPIDGEVSPYLGAGLGYMGADSNGGLGFKVQGGVEALRLHQIRVLAGLEALIPLFSTSDNGSSGNPDRHILPMFFLQFSL